MENLHPNNIKEAKIKIYIIPLIFKPNNVLSHLNYRYNSTFRMEHQKEMNDYNIKILKALNQTFSKELTHNIQ